MYITGVDLRNSPVSTRDHLSARVGRRCQWTLDIILSRCVPHSNEAWSLNFLGRRLYSSVLMVSIVNRVFKVYLNPEAYGLSGEVSFRFDDAGRSKHLYLNSGLRCKKQPSLFAQNPPLRRVATTVVALGPRTHESERATTWTNLLEDILKRALYLKTTLLSQLALRHHIPVVPFELVDDPSSSTFTA